MDIDIGTILAGIFLAGMVCLFSVLIKVMVNDKRDQNVKAEIEIPDWTKGKMRAFALFFGVLTGVFMILSLLSTVFGETIVDETLSETVFERERVKKPLSTWTMSGGVVQMTVSSLSVDNSWLWVKAVILDNKNQAVLNKTFNLSYYSGRNWSEGDKYKTWQFYLPEGTYKLLIYGVDATKAEGYTKPHKETLQVTVQRGVMLTRYFLLGLFICCCPVLFWAYFKPTPAQVMGVEFDDEDW